jgi:FtsH-binding integral membrane protein
MSPIAQLYAKLSVMLVTNVSFCWYPLYYWSTYTANENRDGGVLLIGLFVALITCLVAPFVGFQIWKLSADFKRTLRLRNRVLVLLMC